MSPTQRTLRKLRDLGYQAGIVEHWNAFARIRQDLFHVIDVVAIGSGPILGVQATSWSNHAARRNKSIAEPNLWDWLASGGRFEIWSWRGSNVRREAITLASLTPPKGVKLVIL